MLRLRPVSRSHRASRMCTCPPRARGAARLSRRSGLARALTEATGDDASTALDLLTAVEGPLVRVTADARAGYLPRPPAQ